MTGDQAAGEPAFDDVDAPWNLMPWMTFGNGFSSFKGRHVFAAALTTEQLGNAIFCGGIELPVSRVIVDKTKIDVSGAHEPAARSKTS